MRVDIRYAETHLAELIAATVRGEIVEIETPDAIARIHATAKPDFVESAVTS